MSAPPVVVAGAGPAGCAAAIELAQAGCRVVVYDKAVFPRDKTCGDGLTAGAMRHLHELRVDVSTIESFLGAGEINVSAPSGRARSFPFPAEGIFAATARRLDLDLALVARARAAGAEIYEGVSIESASSGSTGPELALSDGTTIGADVVIAADGMWSRIRKDLAPDTTTYRGEAHALRQYLRPERPHRDLWVWFEPDLLPGYAWSFPLADGTVNAGFGVHRSSGFDISSMSSVWKSLLQRPAVTAVLGHDVETEGPARTWPIPARFGRLPLALGRTLFVGDAAGASDPMSGEGIGQAFESGRAAAAAILRHPTDPGSAYDKTMRATLVRDNRMAERILGLLRYRSGANAAVAIASSTPWVQRNFARWLFEDYPRATVLTPARWRPNPARVRPPYPLQMPRKSLPVSER